MFFRVCVLVEKFFFASHFSPSLSLCSLMQTLLSVVVMLTYLSRLPMTNNVLSKKKEIKVEIQVDDDDDDEMKVLLLFR